MTNAQRITTLQNLLKAASLLAGLENLETYCHECSSKHIARFGAGDMEEKAIQDYEQYERENLNNS